MDGRLKNYLNIAIIIGILLVSGAAWQYAASYSESIQPGQFRSFTVSGEGKVVAVPDVAEFNFEIITEGGTDVAKSQTENAKKANDIDDFLKSSGVEEKDVQTSTYNVGARYENYSCPISIYSANAESKAASPCPPPKIVGYTVTQGFTVKVRDFTKAGDILSGVVRKGANNVSSLEFTIDDRSKLESEAREKAIEDAKMKAKEIAKAGDFRIGKLLQISENGSGPIYFGVGGNYSKMMDQTSIAPAPSAPIKAGSQEIIVNTTLTYAIR